VHPFHLCLIIIFSEPKSNTEAVLIFPSTM
jgi:hypothetical protein